MEALINSREALIKSREARIEFESIPRSGYGLQPNVAALRGYIGSAIP